MKRLLIITTLMALLSACADDPVKEAAIEDRAVRTAKADAKPAEPVKTETAATPEAAKAETTAVATVSAPPATETTALAAAPGTTTAPVEANKVETRPLSETVAEVKPLDAPKTEAGVSLMPAATNNGSPAAAPPAAGTDTAAAASATTAGAAVIMDLKNPASPLAKRAILFDYDSSAIRDDYRTTLEAHAAFLKQRTNQKAVLQGHADERGSREYNIALGQRRAESLLTAMTLLGVPAAQLEAVSLGEEKPVVEGHDEAAWQQNRRAEIHYQGE